MSLKVLTFKISMYINNVIIYYIIITLIVNMHIKKQIKWHRNGIDIGDTKKFSI